MSYGWISRNLRSKNVSYNLLEHAHFGQNPFTFVRALRTACTDFRLRDICERTIAYVTPARKEYLLLLKTVVSHLKLGEFR